jgi:hypothetical protein
MTLDTTSMWFTTAIILAGIFYGQYMYRRGMQTGTDQVIDTLENAGIIQVDDEGIITAKK